MITGILQYFILVTYLKNNLLRNDVKVSRIFFCKQLASLHLLSKY